MSKIDHVQLVGIGDDWRRAYTTSPVTTAVTLPTVSQTAPVPGSDTGVISRGGSLLLLAPFGQDTDNDDGLMGVAICSKGVDDYYYWHLVTTLGVTLGSKTGVAGSYIDTDEFYADTVVVSVGDSTPQLISPGDNTPAMVLVDPLDAQYVQLLVDINSGPVPTACTALNALYKWVY